MPRVLYCRNGHNLSPHDSVYIGTPTLDRSCVSNGNERSNLHNNSVVSVAPLLFVVADIVALESIVVVGLLPVDCVGLHSLGITSEAIKRTRQCFSLTRNSNASIVVEDLFSPPGNKRSFARKDLAAIPSVASHVNSYMRTGKDDPDRERRSRARHACRLQPFLLCRIRTSQCCAASAT